MVMPKKDITGKKFGRLTALHVVRSGGKIPAIWRYRCDCGNEKSIRMSGVTSGSTTSCGCVKLSRSGFSRKPWYRSWKAMMDRCFIESHHAYANYGGRGITVCERWLDPFSFHEDMGDMPEGMTLERIDNAIGYSASNCKWATMLEQQNNKRSNKKYLWNGSMMTIPQICRLTGIRSHLAYARIRMGWSIERAITTPVRGIERSRLQC